MPTIDLQSDITVFGHRVETFPDGVGEAFDAIVKKLPGGFNRSFYGFCLMGNNGLEYYAAALELSKGEGADYGYETYFIQKGKYMAEVVTNWHSKLDSINQVFHGLMADSRADHVAPCVEWYKNDEEMVCMVKIK